MIPCVRMITTLQLRAVNLYSVLNVRVTMYLKHIDDEIYTPVHLTPLTIENLTRTLNTRFSALKDLQVLFVRFVLLERHIKNIE